MSRKKPSRVNGCGIRVGSRVRYSMPGGSSFLLEVIEDRGNVGWRGRYILRVRRISDYPELDFILFASTPDRFGSKADVIRAWSKRRLRRPGANSVALTRIS